MASPPLPPHPAEPGRTLTLRAQRHPHRPRTDERKEQPELELREVGGAQRAVDQRVQPQGDAVGPGDGQQVVDKLGHCACIHLRKEVMMRATFRLFSVISGG